MTILSIPSNVIGPVLRELCSSHGAIVRRISILRHDLSNTIIDCDPKGPWLPHIKVKALILALGWVMNWLLALPLIP